MKKQQLLKKSFLLTLCLYSALLFSNAQAGVLRLTDYSYVAIMQTLYNGPKEGSPYLAADDFLFGEEFEYWVVLDESEDTHDDAVHCKAVNNLVSKWTQCIIKKITELDIPENEYQLTESTIRKSIPLSLLRSFSRDENILTVKIGNWHCKIHPDFWEDKGPGGSHAMLEISASPYKFNQTFTVAGRKFTAYEMIDIFIINITQSLSGELIPASGHKHLDITSSLCGNTELIFRLLIDIENNSWLSQALGTEKDSLSSFRYVSQGEQSDLKQLNLECFINFFNDNIKSLQHFPSPSKSEETFQNHVYTIINDFKYPWKIHFQCYDWCEGFADAAKERFIPADIRFYNIQKKEGHQRALEGKIVDHPDGTLEFRFFDTARSGNEARLINQLLVKWIQHIHKNQRQKEPVSYLPYNPLQACPYSYLTVKEKFNTFITMLGLNPDEYQVIFRMKE